MISHNAAVSSVIPEAYLAHTDIEKWIGYKNEKTHESWRRPSWVFVGYTDGRSDLTRNTSDDTSKVDSTDGLLELPQDNHDILRKEVIQPQVPLRLPCYDLVPIVELTFGTCLPCGLAQ